MLNQSRCGERIGKNLTVSRNPLFGIVCVTQDGDSSIFAQFPVDGCVEVLES
jgi:hypothetical protein